MLKGTSDHELESPRRGRGLSLEARMVYVIMVGKDINDDEEGGACLSVRIFRSRVYCRLEGKASGDPPQLFWLLARGRSGAETGLEEVRDIFCGALGSRGFPRCPGSMWLGMEVRTTEE